VLVDINPEHSSALPLYFKTSLERPKNKIKNQKQAASPLHQLRGLINQQRRRTPKTRVAGYIMDNQEEAELFGVGAAVGCRSGRVQQEVEEDSVEELGVFLLRQVPRLGDHLHRRLLPELPAHTYMPVEL